jgi:hypothetical protein
VSVVRTDRATLDTRAMALIGVALGAGVVLRAAPIAADFPLGDGGLFWAMANELRTNGFLPPDVTGYNGLDIPYVYPPLGLYLLGLLGGDRMWLQIIPALFSIATIPAVWLLGRGLTSHREDSWPPGCMRYRRGPIWASPREVGLPAPRVCWSRP